MTRSKVSLAVLIALLLLTACVSPGLTLQYQIGGCQGEDTSRSRADNRVEITVQDGAVHLSQDVSYVCCASITLKVEREDNLIKVVETNEGEICRCMCGYQITAKVGGLPSGTYRVQVWGIQYQDVHPLELLGEATVNL